MTIFSIIVNLTFSRVLESITASDEGLITKLVLLDLSAAFDTIDHYILHQIGIKGSTLKWFVSDECYFVHVNNHQDMTRLVLEFHMALCLDHYY